MTKIAFAGCKTTTLECMESFLSTGRKIDYLITLTPEQAAKNEVAGFYNLDAFAAEHGIQVYKPRAYSLKNDEDQAEISKLGIEFLLVIGWQRLIPDWFLSRLRFGAFGMHGSPEPLPRGRGRSPLNWSLLNDKKSFTTNLFRYDAGVDSGDIVGSQKFEINDFDTCETLHFKNRIAMNKLLDEHIDRIISGQAVYRRQNPDIVPTYFEKRSAEDGRIIWENVDMRGLFNHIRCQTRPFPGAFSHVAGLDAPVYFWQGVPFDPFLTWHDYPGTITEVFHDGSFLVTVWDGTVHVTDYSAPQGWKPKRGVRFINQPAS